MGGKPEGNPEVTTTRLLASLMSLFRRALTRTRVWEARFTCPVLVFSRARSIYERALDVDYRNVTLWLKYAEMEMKNRQVNHARNIWDRAIITLPRVNQFWCVGRAGSTPSSPKDCTAFGCCGIVQITLFLQAFGPG